MTEESDKKPDARQQLKVLKSGVKEALASIDSGELTKSKAFDDLRERLDKRFEKYILHSIAYHVTPEKRATYKMWNYLLGALFLVSTLYIFTPMLKEIMGGEGATTFGLFLSALLFYFYLRIGYRLFKWQGRAFKVVLILSLFLMLSRLLSLDATSMNNQLTSYTTIILFGLQGGIAAYLSKKIFPSYGWGGPKRINHSDTLDSSADYEFD